MSAPTSIDAVVHAITPASASGGCRTFELRPPDGGTFPPFDAGAHIDVHAGPSLIRQYSLLGSPQERDRYLICVRRDPGGRGGSRAMHEAVTVGQRLRISAPRNHFPLADAARHVLVAGGIGITPLLSMADVLVRRQAEFTFHYYASTRSEAPLLDRLRAPGLTGRAEVHYDDVDGGIRAGLPAALSTPDPEAAVHLCGPGGFMDHVIKEATAAGWRDDQLHIERFAPATPGAARLAAEGSTGAEFAVRIASTGLSYPVPGDRSIADVLAANGVEVELSCEQGMCGACLTPVLAGEPDHRDEVQTPAERAANDRITICCSRSRSPELVLDL
ncbi:oxidoreductase [Streptomyces sp. SID10853]|uniref:PDR/VanB family oxidoreductase n=1 Tax=Streptomyces sp. SID10853 TaxID=2706028 RepID=UPI0013C25434|nr:PDR/VanB family oxidoreductase [Streptomyces sp. SID10853]NDZ82252.1 oxidoreductase [Streptomyces sp. SID10853]